MKWEFAICPQDEADLPSGHKRMKEGDIIAVKPYPWAWGTEEVKRYLIIVVNNLTEEEVADYMSPYYEGDNVGTLEEPGVVTGKRKFNVDIAEIKTHVKSDIDLVKLKDKDVDYQPLKDESIEIDADVLPDNFSLVTNKYTGDFKKAKKHI